MIENDEMDTSDWAVPPETDKMLRERIAVLEDCLLNVISGQQDPNIKAEDLPSLVCGHIIKTDVRIAAFETALKKADAMAALQDQACTGGSFDDEILDARDAYQTARAKVKL